jgi:hypothetical protein
MSRRTIAVRSGLTAVMQPTSGRRPDTPEVAEFEIIVYGLQDMGLSIFITHITSRLPDRQPPYDRIDTTIQDLRRIPCLQN